MFNMDFVTNRFLSRILFIQYTVNTINSEDLLIESIETLNEICESSSIGENGKIDFKNYDVEFFNRLLTCYMNKEKEIVNFVSDCIRSLQFDILSFNILYTACTEFMVRDNTKHVIKDYLKLCDIFNLSSRLTHAILYHIAFINDNSHIILVYILINFIY